MEPTLDSDASGQVPEELSAAEAEEIEKFGSAG